MKTKKLRFALPILAILSAALCCAYAEETKTGTTEDVLLIGEDAIVSDDISFGSDPITPFDINLRGPAARVS